MEEIKKKPQIYTTQEGIEEIKSNLKVYATQEGMAEIKNFPQVYSTINFSSAHTSAFWGWDWIP